jgi:transposase
MQPKKNQIAESLFGALTEHQLFMVNQSWRHIEYLESLIDDIDRKIDELLIPYQQEMKILTSIPSIKKGTATVIIAEIGVNMAHFPTSQHLASWTGVSPGNYESAGKRKSTQIRHPHVKTTLCEAAWATSRCKNCWLANKYWSAAAKRGKKKALVAIAHRMLRTIYSILINRECYQEPLQTN